MTLPPRFTGDLADLPTHAFGHRSLTWWGIIAFFMIESAAFGMAFAAYFFLAGGEQNWPPDPWKPPYVLAGTLFTVLMLLSEIPNTLIKRASERNDLATVKRWMWVMVAMCCGLLVLRVFEFGSLRIWWYDNAYGSIIWTLLFLHLTHFVTDFADTLVLLGLMYSKHAGENRRMVDVSENAMYWRFVWLLWIPIYLMIYWVPRWVS
jgi:cytochrome c oxidase subunit 3